MTSRIFATALLLCTFLPSLLLYGQPGDSDAISEQPNIDCSPAPCILPEIGTGDRFGLSFVANTSNAQQLMFSTLASSGYGSYADHSGDGGATWVQTLLPDYGDGGFNSGSFVAYNLNNLAYAVWTEGPNDLYGYTSVGFSTSGDNGSTWSAAKEVVSPTSRSQPFAESVTVDDTPSSPFANTIYIPIHQSGLFNISAFVAVATGPPEVRRGVLPADSQSARTELLTLSGPGHRPTHLALLPKYASQSRPMAEQPGGRQSL